MQKIFNLKSIVIFLIGLLFGGIGVYAASQIFAKEVNFVPTNENWEVNNVEDALNDLYSNKSLKYYDSAYGSGQSSVTAYKTRITKELEKGEYYMMVIRSAVDYSSTAFTLDFISPEHINITGCSNFEMVFGSSYSDAVENNSYGSQNFYLYKITMDKDDNLLFDYSSTNDRNLVLHFFKA